MNKRIAEKTTGRGVHSGLAGVTVIAAVIAVASSVTGCAKAERFVLEADKAQAGAGARIELEGDVGRIKMAVTPGWPNGLDKAVTLSADSNSLVNQFWTVTMEPKTELVFIRAPGGWICQSCVYLRLPIMWHPVAV